MKLGFIGTGKIICDSLEALKNFDQIEKTAVFARPHSKEKALKLAEEYKIQKVFTDYDQLLSSPEVDTVYIGLINSAHFSYAKKALLKNKNVILEKPFTGFYAQARQLVKLARKKKLFLFEAVTILHSPVIPKIKELLPELGKIKQFSANYSQYSSRYDDYLNGKDVHAFNPKFYGGALFDINIYNVNYCAALFGLPEKVRYFSNKGYNKIDTSGTLVLQYKDFVCICQGAKDSDSSCFVSIQGEKGFLKIDSKPNVAEKITINYVDKNSSSVKRDAAGAVVRSYITKNYDFSNPNHRMVQEFLDFDQIIKNKDFETRDKLLSQSLNVLKILEKARKNAKIRF